MGLLRFLFEQMQNDAQGRFFSYARQLGYFLHCTFYKLRRVMHKAMSLAYKNIKAWLNGRVQPSFCRIKPAAAWLYHFGLNAPVANGLPHGHQFVPTAFLYRAFAFEVDDPSALLGLLGGMFTYFNQGLNDMVKSVYIVIENDQIVHLFFYNNCVQLFKYGGCFFG
jgi:hypothetical protein